MKKIDLAVMYRGSIAQSALNEDYEGKTPFSLESKYKSYNKSYAYLMKTLKDLGLSAVFTTTDDIIENGRFRSFWTFKNKKWKREKGLVKARVLFDKFSPSNPHEEALFKKATKCSCVETYNSPYIVDLFGDKLTTYKEFSEHCIPTVSLPALGGVAIKESKEKLRTLLKSLGKKLPAKGVLKDRTGAGGYGIHKINLESIDLKRIQALGHQGQQDKKAINYILQPFIDCQSSELGVKDSDQATDLRLIYCGKKLQQAYVRTAASDDFRCNTHQGGDIDYISLSKIPRKIRKKSKAILDILNERVPLRHHLFALDFVMTPHEDVYFMEGNSNPGITWTEGDSQDERRTKELIELISKGLQGLVESKRQLSCDCG